MCSVQVCRPGAGLAVAVLDLCGQMWFTLEEKARVVCDETNRFTAHTITTSKLNLRDNF